MSRFSWNERITYTQNITILLLIVCRRSEAGGVARLQYCLWWIQQSFSLSLRLRTFQMIFKKEKKWLEKAKITPGEVLTNIEWHLPGIWIKTKGRVGFLLGDIYTWAQSWPRVKTDRRRVDIPSAAAFEVFRPFSVFSMRCKTALVCCRCFFLRLYVMWAGR